MRQPPDAELSPAWQPTTVQNQQGELIEANNTPPVRQSAAVGDEVCCEREAPARGSWPRFAGRTGTVVTINRRDDEIGVDLGGGPGRLAWLKPDELVVVTDAPKQPPIRRLLHANGEVGESAPIERVTS